MTPVTGAGYFETTINGVNGSWSWNDSTGSMTLTVNGASTTATVIGEGMLSVNNMCVPVSTPMPQMAPPVIWESGSFGSSLTLDGFLSAFQAYHPDYYSC